ncbi:MAG: FtsX-like permease family protein [Pseudomonadales bacterium]
MLLAGVAVALSAHRYARRHFDHVAVLKTLGATPNVVLQAYTGVLLLVGSVAVVIGLGTGAVLHLGIVRALGALVSVELPPPGFRPFLVGTLTGLVCALAFALPPLLHLRGISPMRVIRRDVGGDDASRLVSYAAAAAGGLALLVWYTRSLTLTLWTLAGVAGVLLVFGTLAVLLLRGSRLVGTQAASYWRLALAGLQRRSRESVAQVLIFGLAVMLLAVLVLLRTALLDDWRAQIPVDTPNHFVMNVMPEEREDVDRLIAQGAVPGSGSYPIIRGRVIELRGESARAIDDAREAQGGDTGVQLGSERNLTWAGVMPEDNTLVEGEWWAPAETRPLVSLEADYAREFGIHVGDSVAFDVAGTRVETVVASLRQLDWESMRPNFFIIFSPGVLEHYPATYMTSFFLPKENKAFLNTLLSRFPTITVLEVDAIIEQVQRIVDRVTQAVELILGLVVVSGCLVLLASIQASRDAREAEHALIRALGGTRRLIRGALLVEFSTLGLLAGCLAAIGAESTVAVLHHQVFDLDVVLHPWLWVLAPVTSALLVGSVGLLGTLKLTSTPPMRVLRGNAT